MDVDDLMYDGSEDVTLCVLYSISRNRIADNNETKNSGPRNSWSHVQRIRCRWICSARMPIMANVLSPRRSADFGSVGRAKWAQQNNVLQATAELGYRRHDRTRGKRSV